MMRAMCSSAYDWYSRDHARDRARLLCRAAEQRPLRILAIEVVRIASDSKQT